MKLRTLAVDLSIDMSTSMLLIWSANCWCSIFFISNVAVTAQTAPIIYSPHEAPDEHDNNHQAYPVWLPQDVPISTVVRVIILKYNAMTYWCFGFRMFHLYQGFPSTSLPSEAPIQELWGNLHCRHLEVPVKPQTQAIQAKEHRSSTNPTNRTAIRHGHVRSGIC